MRRLQHLFVIAVAIAPLTSAAALAAQQDDREWLENCQRQAERSRRAVHCEVRNATVALPAGSLSIDPGRNGGAVVRSGPVSAAEVSARVQVHADTDAEAASIARNVRVVGDDGRLRSEGPSSERWSVTYYVTVPQRTDLDITAVNGPISVTAVHGRIRTEASNGPVQLEQLAGDVRARVTNGPLTVVLAGNRWDGAGLSAETVNGPARLVIPDDYSAALELGTVNGPMNVDLGRPITVSGNLRGRFSTTVGAGGPTVRVVTTNGPFSVRRQ
jgi:hypothetical protein